MISYSLLRHSQDIDKNSQTRLKKIVLSLSLS